MLSSTLLIQVILSGCFVGAIYALLSAGFSLIWGVMGVLNMAQAVFGIFGAYMAYWFCVRTGYDPLISSFIIIPILFILGVMIYKLLIQRLSRVKAVLMASVVLTFGLTLIIENAMSYFWGPDARIITTKYSGLSISAGSVLIPVAHLIGFTLAIVGIALIYFFIHNTFIGKAVQATWQEPEGAALSGVNINRVSMITFGLALASAGMGGLAMALVYAFYPSLHLTWLLYVFLVTIVGGVGSIVGTMVGGLIIGLITSVGGAFIPYAWVNLLVFGLLMLVLLVKPAGLFKT